MEAYFLDWLTLIARWAHIVVGIAWIGASFYFIWLDNHLEAAKDPAFAGELYAIHGGGFYRAQKYRLAPDALPPTLHWFKWEAYWTWLTGFVLLVLVYYLNADLYLIDPQVMKLSPGAAIGIGLGSLVLGLAVYEGLCRAPLGERGLALALLIVFGFCRLGADADLQRPRRVHPLRRDPRHDHGGERGARDHPGAARAGARQAGGPGPRREVFCRGKQRSVHNTYFTLPVIFTMISGHHAMTFGGGWNWLVLIAMALAGALIRLWFVARHKGSAPAWTLVSGLVLVAAVAAILAPGNSAGPAVPLAEAKQVIDRRCVSCHADKPAFQGLAEAPKGVKLDSPERIEAQRLTIHQQTVLTRAMPPGNLTGMTDEERALLDRWVRIK